MNTFRTNTSGSPIALLPYYPILRYVNGEIRLFNPVLRKSYLPRPEERVRLSFIDMLLTEELFPAARIGFEVPVDALHADSATRADIVLYDEDFKPWMLVECKAPGVPVTEATAIQAAQYNRRLNAPWVVLTNGTQLLATHNSLLSPLPFTPLPGHISDVPLCYWLDRGFLTESTSGEEWVALCNELYKGSYPVRWSETPVVGWQAAKDGWGFCLNQGRLVAWNADRMIGFESGDPIAWVRGL